MNSEEAVPRPPAQKPPHKNQFSLTITEVGVVAIANYMALQTNLPWYCMAGIVVFSLAAMAAQLATTKSDFFWSWACAGTLLAWAGAWVGRNRIAFDGYYAVVAGQLALGALIIANRPGAECKKSRWNFLGIAWGFVGTVVLLTASYLDNLPGQFWLGVGVGFTLLILCRMLFKLRPWAIQVVNTGLLMFFALVVADTVIRVRTMHKMSYDPVECYSYEAAKKDPAGYILWWRYYHEQWDKMMHQVMMRDPDHFVQFRFRPDTQGFLCRSTVRINHHGFRGAEVPEEKGNAYRIVALGESTTFGCTLEPEDRSWPNLLEQMIRKRLHPARPVQVINAGIPGATLPGNLGRLVKEILPIKPDMIISYHGYNGFYMLQKGMPPTITKPPPPYMSRPSRLLGDFEYAIKLRQFNKTVMPGPVPDQPASKRPMESDYAKAYRKLIEITQTNGIQLVLADYSMAVTTNSDPALLDFYEQTTPAVRNALRANLAHTEIVTELAKEHPEICFVDTHPSLDGKHEHFIDVMHFTQSGRQKMAETFFAGIKQTLEAALAKTKNSKTR